jgi:glycosyltransferase involved in cell wall biosynthesis
MKIVFVSPGYLYSDKLPFERRGSESEIYGISKEMVKRGHDVYITGRFGNLKGKECETIDGIQFINIKTPHLKDEIIYEIGSSLLYSKAAAKKIKQINPDVISLNERFSAYFPSKLNLPKTFTTHNPDAMAFYKEFALKSNRLNYIFFDVKKGIEESIMSRSDIIITLTKSIREYLHENGFTNTSIIPNAVDAEEYINNRDENFILYAGRFRKFKGVTYLIQAFSEISKDYDTDLLLVGSGPDEERIKKMAASKNLDDRVQFIPLVDKTKLREYLSKCKVFVFPSLFEAFGVVVIEAMASGKPVIASDIPGPKDIITQGYDGFLFEKQNVNELKRYLELCLSDEKLRRKIGENARKTVEEKYTFNKIAQEYFKIYKLIRGS